MRNLDDSSNTAAANTAAGAVQGAGKGAAGDVCERCCKNRIKEISDETNRIRNIQDPIERNKEITRAYNAVAAQDPQNRWVKLASIVSVQGGCAMQQVKDARSYLPSFKDWLDEKTGVSFTKNMYQALGEANKSIFSDIYPYAAYRAKYGTENMKKCYAEEGKPIPPELEDAFDKMDRGELNAASDAIAKFEQMKVVQSVYDQYSGTFWEMKAASSVQEWFTGKNLYDIPLSTTCGDPNTVPFEGDIAKGSDRVAYYQALMSRLKAQQGW